MRRKSCKQRKRTHGFRSIRHLFSHLYFLDPFTLKTGVLHAIFSGQHHQVRTIYCSSIASHKYSQHVRGGLLMFYGEPFAPSIDRDKTMIMMIEDGACMPNKVKCNHGLVLRQSIMSLQTISGDPMKSIALWILSTV